MKVTQCRLRDELCSLADTRQPSSDQFRRLRRNLERAMRRELTDRQRQLLELHYARRMSVAEIARALDLSPSTVSRTLKRARERLYRSLRYSL